MEPIPKPKPYRRKQRQGSATDNHHPHHPLPSSDRNKKTRDLPNLSECQSCGFRIDVCSGGKNGLQTLYSEWRIVLLCRNCYALVGSSQLCSYCFKEPSPSLASFTCCHCHRIVHQTCLSKFANVAPWSYSSSPSSSCFSVCVDCWIPTSLAAKRRFPRSARKRNFLESRNSMAKENCESQSLQDVAMEANSAVKNKVETAARARELAMRKALVARRAAEVASSALDICTIKDNAAAAMEANARDGGAPDDKVAVVDDAALAFQLHRAMNSSPRIAKNFCQLNSSCFADRKMCDRGGETMLIRSSNAGKSGVPRKLEGFYGVSTNLCCDSLTDKDVLKSDKTDKPRVAKDDNLEMRPKDGEGSCSNRLINTGADDNITNSESQSLGGERDGSLMPEDERCWGNPGRYLMKYSRRKLNENRPISSYYEYMQRQAQASGMDLMLNCSNESMSFSNSSLQSCTLSVQASICSSGLCREQS